MSPTQTLIDRLQSRFDPAAAGSLDAVFQYRVESDPHYLSIQEGRCTAVAGEAEEADATLTLDAATLEALLDGEMDGMQAFMGGQLQVQGDMMLAMRLTELFPAR